MPCRIHKHDGIIPTIGIQVQSVVCSWFKIVYTIRRDESARFGVVVAAVQVVEPRLRVVIVPTVAERVDLQNFRADLRKQVAPGVVFVLPEKIPAGIVNPDDIALQVLAVEILLPVVFEIITDSRLVVNKGNDK